MSFTVSIWWQKNSCGIFTKCQCHCPLHDPSPKAGPKAGPEGVDLSYSKGLISDDALIKHCIVVKECSTYLRAALFNIFAVIPGA